MLRPDQEEDYNLPAVSDAGRDRLRALRPGPGARLPKLGPHGLPLMGTGDWNDGMNKVGAHGKGESVWNGWFFVTVLKAFAELAERRGRRAAGGVVPGAGRGAAGGAGGTRLGRRAGTAGPTSTTARRSARPRTTSARSTPSRRPGR